MSDKLISGCAPIQLPDRMEAYKQILGKRVVKIKEIHNTEFEIDVDRPHIGLGSVDWRFILTCDDGTEITV